MIEGTWIIKQTTPSPPFQVEFSNGKISLVNDTDYFGSYALDSHGNLAFSIADPCTSWAGNKPSVSGYYAEAKNIKIETMSGFAGGANDEFPGGTKFSWSAKKLKA